MQIRQGLPVCYYLAMTELEACTYVADLLKAVGFEHRWSSMKSEACYYALPDRREVLRVAAHRYAGPEFGMAPVIVCVTFTQSMNWGEHKLHDMTARAIGMYHLRSAGLVALTAKERARRHHRRISTISPSSTS